MIAPRHAAAPGRESEGEANIKAGEPLPIVPATWRVTEAVGSPTRCPRPDLLTTYPDPRVNYRSTMFGLALDQYRAEWARRNAEGWARWELDARLPHPGARG